MYYNKVIGIHLGFRRSHFGPRSVPCLRCIDNCVTHLPRECFTHHHQEYDTHLIYIYKILKVYNANYSLLPNPLETTHLNNVWVHLLFINIQFNFLSLNQITLVTGERDKKKAFLAPIHVMYVVLYYLYLLNIYIFASLFIFNVLLYCDSWFSSCFCCASFQTQNIIS